jgi:glycosyltransferase involved in cell wall biosynthesis
MAGAASPDSMNNIYFDITDIIHYSEKNYRVTGIQRVQLRLMADIIKAFGNHHAKGLAFLGSRKGWQSMDLAFLNTDKEFNATEFLVQTGKLEPSRFPPRNQIRQHLERYNNRKPLRSLKKAAIYLQAIFCPEYLQSNTGLTIYKGVRPSVPSNQSFQGMQQGDIFAILGASWNILETEKLARQHHAAGGKVALLVYDIIPHTHPQLQTEEVCEAFNAWLSRTPDYVTDYICISEHTAQEMRRYLSSRKSSARVVAMPMAHEFPGYERNHVPQEAELARIRQVVPGPFVLCVGSIEIRKNGVMLLKAWEKVRATLGSSTPTLVFAGKIAWKSEAFTTLMHDTDHVHGTACLFESPTDKELAALYKQCLFTVYPSLVEGWGLPVGESAWFGKFAVVSSASSIPEVCGPLVDYVDPTNVDDIAASLLHALQNAPYVASRAEAIQQASLRTWEQVAIRLHELLQNGALESRLKETHPAHTGS